MKTKKKRVLVLCIHNSCGSLMAEGLARHYGKGWIETYHAGSRPAGQINPSTVGVMREKGVDISRQKPKGFDQFPQIEFDYVITMGCQDACPIIPTKARIE